MRLDVPISLQRIQACKLQSAVGIVMSVECPNLLSNPTLQQLELEMINEVSSKAPINNYIVKEVLSIASNPCDGAM